MTRPERIMRALGWIETVEMFEPDPLLLRVLRETDPDMADGIKEHLVTPGCRFVNRYSAECSPAFSWDELAATIAAELTAIVPIEHVLAAPEDYILEWPEPWVGIDSDGDERTCCVTNRISAKEAIEVTRYQRAAEDKKRGTTPKPDNPGRMLLDFVTIHFAKLLKRGAGGELHLVG